MSRNNKNAKRKAQAKVITAMHQRGEKGAAKTAPLHTKVNAWWQKFRTYGDFAKGSKGSKSDA
jgi:hypothetical protein